MKMLNGTGNVNMGRDDKPSNSDMGDERTGKPKPKPQPKAKSKLKTVPASKLVGKVKGL